MKKHRGLTAKILFMVSLTAVLICLGVTVTGAAMIYFATENGIRSEVNCAARALWNCYDNDYHGDYYMTEGVLFKGSEKLTEKDFLSKASLIACSRDVDFTLFWNDTRIFTTLKDPDGVFFTGTAAEKRVNNMVLGKGMEYYDSHITINDTKYAGYYIPIMNSSAVPVGMIFAGKPLDAARKNTRFIVGCFVLISLLILAAALYFIGKFSSKLVNALLDLKSFMEKVSSESFDASLDNNTVTRTDEVGDIARSADTLKNNLQILVERDPLTTLLNRRSCRKLIDGLIEQKKPYTAAMADVDHFKRINDSFGHACGDMVLTEISHIISSETRKAGGFASRWGGEEFLIILPERSISETREFLEKLLEHIRSKEFDWKGEKLPVTFTAGAAQAENGEAPDDTINRADHLLYDGKKSGRNRIVV